MNDTEAALGFVGLGVMGGPMCANLARRSGRTVIAYDRDPAAFAPAVAAGAHAASSLADLCRGCGVVFLCLPHGEVVRAVCCAIAAAPGAVRLVVDCSTTSVALTREIAGLLQAAGVGFADAPVTRMRQAAQDGTLCFLVGAEAELFAALHPLLAGMGTDILPCGPVGSGQIVKILNNMVLIGTVHALAGALRAARGQGVDGAVLFDALASGSADSRALRVQGMRHLLTGDFPPGAFSTVYARKDLALAEELFALSGVDDALLRVTAATLDRAAAAGLGDAYYPAFVDVLGRQDGEG